MASEAEILRELDALGERRKRHDEAEEKLAKDTKKALKKAYGVVSVAEAARRCGIHRTTVYRVYSPHARNAA